MTSIQSLISRASVPVLPSKAKRALAGVSLLALGVTFDLTSRYVPEMQDEISDWEDGRRVAIGVLPAGPTITIQKSGNRIQYLGLKKVDPDLSILFKNLDSAVMIFTAQLGAPWAVAENRVCVQGDNYKAMQVTRAMAIVQTYLFPGFLLNNIFKRPPVLSASQLATKAKIMGLLTPKLIAASFK
jgi:hypothetical protein